MIDKLSYEDVLTISKDIKEQAEIIQHLAEQRGVTELSDFIATVEGYSKFLETTVKLNKDADEALEDLKKHIK